MLLDEVGREVCWTRRLHNHCFQGVIYDESMLNTLGGEWV